MDRWRRVRFRTWSFSEDGDGLLPSEAEREGFVLAIGAPQGHARRGTDRREAEKTPGIRPRARGTGVPGESARLFAALRRKGLGLLGEASNDDVSLLETCPEELWRIWAGRRISRMSLPAGRRARHDILRGLGLELPLGRDAIIPDELEAAACAFVAYLWASGNAKVHGTIRGGRIVSA
jgi:hypothetical protein